MWLTARPAASASGPVTVISMQTLNDADATLLYQQGAAVLIDTGEECDAAQIIEKMKKLGVEKLDCLILSHPDADHIGGAAAILSQIPADCVIQPYCTVGDDRLTKLNTWLDDQRIPVLYPTHTHRLRVGQMQLLVFPPLEKHYNDTNNYSLAVLVQHGQINMLFAGDALGKRSDELLCVDWPPIDLYKVAHHGRANRNTKALFDALHPAYAIVTAKEADQAIHEAAQTWGTLLYYTADGDCTFVSDGKTLTPQ